MDETRDRRRGPGTPGGELDAGFAWVIVELAPDGIIVCDDSGVILMANGHIEEMFGFGRDDLIGASIESLLPARLRARHREHVDEYAAAPTTRPMGVGLELLGCRADGSEFPVEISLSAVAGGRGTAIVAIIRDVTEQRALEQTARRALLSDEGERIAVELHDRVITRIFGAGLTLASVVHQVERSAATRIYEAVDQLDIAIHDLRSTIFNHQDRNTDNSPGAS